MLSHFFLVSKSVQSCLPLALRVDSCRSFSATFSIRSELSPAPSSDAELLKETEQGVVGTPEEERLPETYTEFIETIGAKFKKADAPNKWLGDQPFPMNSSFRPPPPVSDTVRTAIYREYMRDPDANNIRVLSQRYHLSLKRIDAILRLKGMEQDWIKGMPLQKGFQIGMEKILGVSTSRSQLSHIESRIDTHEVDTLEQEEQRDAARQRYQRLYWESVPEDGREPIVPASLENAKLAAKRLARAQEAYKSGSRLMPRVKDTDVIKTPRTKVQIVTKPGRPAIKFIDVGGKFVDVDERLRRIAKSERRARMKETSLLQRWSRRN